MRKKGFYSFLMVTACWGTVCISTTAFATAGYSKSSAKIDVLVDATLKDQGIKPSLACSDEVFLRRVYLDMIGTLPRANEARSFLRSNAGDKRTALIESMFDRPEYADYWSLKWCDLLRVKAEFPSNLWPNAVQAYHRWLRTAMRDNMPYDEFATALLTSSGSNFREAPVNFYRALAKREPPEMAAAASLLFMGVRTDHLTAEQQLGMAAFFGNVGYKKTAEWKEEIVFFDPSLQFLDPETELPVDPSFPDGTKATIVPGQDPRAVFAAWLVADNNPLFAKSIVNRMWFWLMGRGIVHEPDDMRADNPPSNPALLDFLAKELITNEYDLRHIFRIILNSKTYQRSAIHTPSNEKDEIYFSRYYVRRLDAEVLIDAICQITGSKEEYSSAIPEPFTWIPESQRSIALSDGSITSPFLDLYGRPPRDTGFELERNNTPSSSQVLHLLNSSHIRNKLELSPLVLELKRNLKIKRSTGGIWGQVTPEEYLDRMYLTILSRFPTDEEVYIAMDYIKNGEVGALNGIIDVAWALINTKEFAFKH